eukprot:CAMPEP_0168612028 /NCGR_PEP_ID=MMETSP0449_2-20121227/2685_1 /TAXON_ID=1082188 /ORGANISM="Strombidium rassoulzadegani, Strain ras09" /LENGTH=69 /DNA_ID=CAMNT_0008652539 /DNA_START=233 /DNA_END=438 /DNA_ORIENTATION=-
MAYNMGGGGLAEFKNFKGAIQDQDYNRAAKELSKSLVLLSGWRQMRKKLAAVETVQQAQVKILKKRENG